MEIVDLRQVVSADLRPLVEEEVETWQSTLHWDYRPLAEMLLRYTDSHILPGVAATEGGRVCGYCFFFTEGTKGGIGDLYVEGMASTHNRRHDIEIELLRHAILRLRRSPELRRVEAQLLIHPTDRLATPFLEGGYRRYRRVFLRLKLEETNSGFLRHLAPEVEVRRWSEADYRSAADAITAAYKGHVECCVGDQFRTIEGTLGFMNNIVRFPTCGVFDSGASFIACQRDTQAPIAVLLCSRLRQDVGHITQVCTLPEFRGFGIGEHLVRHCHNDLFARGFTELSLTVTEENHRALAFYRRLGFSQLHTFDAFVWETE